jgi:4-amino-4-deoxy-L-arabinose transferase-like glycosyltransferase
MARRTMLLIVAAMVAGLGIRVANIVWLRPMEVRPFGATDYVPENPRALVLGGDGFHYHHSANALADGLGFIDPYLWVNLHTIEPTGSHPPAYTVYLAAFSLVGLDTPDDHRLASALLGLVTIAGVAGAARRLAGDRAAIIAAWMVALYPGAWINDTMLLSEALAQAAVACFLYASVRLWRERSWRWAAASGVAAAVATLTRNEQIVLFGVLLIMVVARRGQPILQGIKLAAVAGLAGAVLIVPWVARNLVTFDEPSFMTTSAGSALSAASCAGTYSGPSIGWYQNCFQGPFPRRLVDPRTGRTYFADASGRRVDESTRDIEPMRQARAWIGDHLREYPKVVAARVGRLWGWFRPFQTTRFEIIYESRGGWQSWAGLWSLWVLEILGVAGLVIMRRRRLPISPILALVGVATFGAAITFGIARYRSTAEIGLLLAAAIAVSAGFDRLDSRRRDHHDHAASTPIPPSSTQTTSAATR